MTEPMSDYPADYFLAVVINRALSDPDWARDHQAQVEQAYDRVGTALEQQGSMPTPDEQKVLKAYRDLIEAIQAQAETAGHTIVITLTLTDVASGLEVQNAAMLNLKGD